MEVATAGRTAEAAGERLTAMGAVAVTYLDDGDNPLLEPDPGAAPNLDAWPKVRVTGLFEIGADLSALRSAFPDQAIDIEFLADEDWLNAWRRFAVVRKFGRLTIIPSAPEAADVAGKDASVPCSTGASGTQPCSTANPVVMRLDPGLAFGTGSHPTTRLCLEWLAARDMRDRSMLDYGCGSGILVIAAKLLGAGRVVGVDHDPQALMATETNAARNGVRFAVKHGEAFSRDDVSTSGETGRVNAPFDVVMSNILSGTLVALAPLLSGCVAATGTLVLTGILADEADGVMRAYPDFEFRAPLRLKEWVLLHGEHI